jgi:hypothetical protein
MNRPGSVAQTMLTKVQVRADHGRAAASQVALPPPVQTQLSRMKIPKQESPVLSPRGKASQYKSKSTRDTANYEYCEPTCMPGCVRDADVKAPRQALSLRSPDRSGKRTSQNSPKERKIHQRDPRGHGSGSTRLQPQSAACSGASSRST